MPEWLHIYILLNKESLPSLVLFMLTLEFMNFSISVDLLICSDYFLGIPFTLICAEK